MEINQLLQSMNLNNTLNDPQTITGSLRINSRNYTDAFISDPQGGQDIYIEGTCSRRAALDGDIVLVCINHYSKWKINVNLITTHWDEWSKYLIPIIRTIEQSGHVENSADEKLDTRSLNEPKFEVDGLTSESQESGKRIEKTKTKDRSAPTRLPSNLPNGISKLAVENVIHLPISSHFLRKTGFVTEVIKRKNPGIAGGFLKKYSQKFALFSPLDSRIPRMMIPIEQCPNDFKSQADRYKSILFVAQITNWDINMNFALGMLVKIIGDSHEMQSRMESLLIEHQVFDQDFGPNTYSELNYLNNLTKNWVLDQCQSRRDLTSECIFTIDPKTARDLDDAVSVKQISGQIYQVGVHIADVSYFVKELSSVDYEARLRTTSVYLVDRVIPMLPSVLCEQMCSLNPGEPKLTFSVIWKMNKYGHIIDEWFGRTVIKSCVKLAYEQAQDMIDNPNDISWIKEGENMPKLHAFDWIKINKSVNLLNKIARNLRAKRFDDGALRIEQVKMKFELDCESGYPNGFSFESRSEANFLIEEYMLLANMAVAKRIYKHSKSLALLRRHPASAPNMLMEVKEFCDAKGCDLDISSSGSIQKSLNKIADPTMMKVVSFLLLRAMKNAEYVCVGSVPDDESLLHHFALNVPFYTHFTSPIRRYADILVHRSLSCALGYQRESLEDVDSVTMMADECTKRKISSKIISDTSQKWYFNMFVKKAGFCELLACVTRIYDMSFEVILVNYDRTGRVYMDRLSAQLESLKFQSFSGNKRLVLNWKTETSKKVKKKNKKRKKLTTDEQLTSRTSLESRISRNNHEMQVNEAVNNQQIIQVFDVIRVIVTIDEKDFTQLRIDLKGPNQ